MGLEKALIKIVKHIPRRLGKAEKELRKLLEKYGYRLEIVEILAKVLAGQGKVEEAIRILDKASEANPNSPRPLILKAVLLNNAGRRDEARRVAERAYEMAKGTPDEPWALDTLVSFIENEDPDRALDLVEEGLRRFPDSVDLLVRKAEILWFKKDNAEIAEKTAEKALRILRNAAALYILASIYLARNEAQKARRLLEEAVSLDPSNPLYWYLLAVALYNLDEDRRALDCVERALNIKPGFVEALVLKAELLIVLGYREEALRTIDEAISLDPDFGSAYLTKGVMLKTMGRFDEAERCYLRALELAPDDPEVYWVLASFYADRGDFDRALEYLSRAEVLGGGSSPDFWLAKGKILEKLGRRDEALKAYEEGLRLAREDLSYIRLFENAIKRLRR